jgi:excisionase family DNA binding protein
MHLSHEIEKTVNNNDINIIIKLNITLEEEDFPTHLINRIVDKHVPKNPGVDQVTNSNDNKTVYTATDIQSILGLSKNTTYHIINSNCFKTLKLGRKILIPRDSFEKWLNGDS